jgi:hypothetical protein
MTRAPILFRCDGTATTGWESFYQCLVLAGAMQRRRRGTYFLSRLEPQTLAGPILRGGHEWNETTTEVGPGIHLWVQLYQQERRHLADVCAKALAAGAQERQVQLAERQGELAAQILTAVLDDLHLSAADRQRAVEVAGRHFTLLRGTG